MPTYLKTKCISSILFTIKHQIEITLFNFYFNFSYTALVYVLEKSHHNKLNSSYNSFINTNLA